MLPGILLYCLVEGCVWQKRVCYRKSYNLLYSNRVDHKLFANGDVFNIFVVTFPQSFSRNITIRLFQLSVFQKNIHELNWPKWSIFWPRVFFSAHLVKMASLLRSKSLLCFVFLTKYYVTQYKSSSLKLHNNTKNTLTSRDKT